MPKISSETARKLAKRSHEARRRNKLTTQARLWRLPTEKIPVPTPDPPHVEPLPDPFEKPPRRWPKGFEPNLHGPRLTPINLSSNPDGTAKVYPTIDPPPPPPESPWVAINGPRPVVQPEKRAPFAYHPFASPPRKGSQ